MSEAEIREMFPTQKPERPAVSHLKGRMIPGTRTPAPTMVLIETDEEIEEPNTGRRFNDVKQVITKEMKGAILCGHMCLKCKEPFPERAFPDFCDVCGYEVGRRQILDAGMELEGEVHVGPSKPISEFLAELDENEMKSEFERKLREGKSPITGLKHG